MKDHFTIALVGNPNSGKTTLFNALTGTQQKVGNWPGVTVEKKTGLFTHGNLSFELVDLPGTYSLHMNCDDDSLDQQIAQRFILDDNADLILNVIDASSLERGLYLSTQLMDARIPMVIALNMTDIADQNGVHIDPNKLSAMLGIPVVALVASRNEGVGSLVDVIHNTLYGERATETSTFPLTTSERLEATTQKLLGLMDDKISRLRAVAILGRDQNILDQFSPTVQANMLSEVDALEADLKNKQLSSATDALISERYQWIGDVTAPAVQYQETPPKTLSTLLDNIFLHRLFAFPLFLAVMYLMFMVTINFGGAFIDLFDIAAGAIFVETPRLALQAIHCPQWLTTLLCDGVGGGIQLVASFIPVIGTLFLFQSFLEDSGYMARAAFILDRVMRSIGLPGKSFVPLVVGFGCNVPSVMASRTMDAQQDRLLTTLMAPFMSCGARLTVYILFAAAFFADNGQNVVFGLYIIGIILAVITGLLVRRRLLSREITPFIMELPSYHVPTLKGLMINTWHRLKGFVMRAGKAIVLVVIVLNFVNAIGVDGSFGNENTENSLLSQIGKSITPIFEPIGVQQDNWPATVGIFSGIFAKEVVVGTLDALYNDMAQQGKPDAEDEPVSITGMFNEAFASVPANLKEITGMWDDPLGIGVGDLHNSETAAEDQGVELSTITLMQQLFVTPIAAFSYLLFVLLYMPCVATLGAIYKEAGSGWAIFSATWNTVLAYGAAVITFQLGTFSAHPQQSLLWTGAMLAAMGLCYLLLVQYGKQQLKKQNLIAAVNLH